MKIHIVDYGMGNIFSVQKKLLQENATVSISSNYEDIAMADKIILLGVGHFKKAMDNLEELNLIEPLNDFALVQKKPILGICLGMQLLFDQSNEFVEMNGLKLIEGRVTKFNRVKKNITHLGWNKFKIKEKNLRTNFKKFENNLFYFVHSYYVMPNDKKNIFASTKYGNVNFCSIVKKSNILGTQFHPEKSGPIGVEFLKNLKKFKT